MGVRPTVMMFGAGFGEVGVSRKRALPPICSTGASAEVPGTMPGRHWFAFPAYDGSVLARGDKADVMGAAVKYAADRDRPVDVYDPAGRWLVVWPSGEVRVRTS